MSCCRTHVSSYKNHKYSGPRKSRKRVQAAMKQLHGHIVSRSEIWRKPSKNKQIEVVHNEENSDSTCKVQYTPELRTYSRQRNSTPSLIKNIAFVSGLQEDCLPNVGEINDLDIRGGKIIMDVTPSSDIADNLLNVEEISDLEIIDEVLNEDESHPDIENNSLNEKESPHSGNDYQQETMKESSRDSLNSWSEYRIAELKHVLQFKLEKHRQSCKSSQIEFVSECRKEATSILTFKCSMCDEVWHV